MSITALVSIDDFAATRKVSTKTVRRWLADGRIQGATKLGNKWSLPANAVVQDTLPGVMSAPDVHPWAPSQQPVSREVVTYQAPPAPPTVADVLAAAPVMVPLETAARVLGVSEYALRRNAEFFQLERMGDHGAYVMPKARIRQLEG
jgi:hypothetical protein